MEKNPNSKIIHEQYYKNNDIQLEIFEFNVDNIKRKITHNHSTTVFTSLHKVTFHYRNESEIVNIMMQQLIRLMNTYNINSLHIYSNNQMVIFDVDNNPSIICNNDLVRGIKLKYNSASAILETIKDR